MVQFNSLPINFLVLPWTAAVQWNGHLPVRPIGIVPWARRWAVTPSGNWASTEPIHSKSKSSPLNRPPPPQKKKKKKKHNTTNDVIQQHSDWFTPNHVFLDRRGRRCATSWSLACGFHQGWPLSEDIVPCSLWMLQLSHHLASSLQFKIIGIVLDRRCANSWPLTYWFHQGWPMGQKIGLCLLRKLCIYHWGQ